MHKNHVRPAAFGVALVAVTPWSAPPGLAASAQSFDGARSVEGDCPDVGDVRGYDWRFPAEVTSGVATGSYHSPTNGAMGQLSGRIRPGGEAALTVAGRTGPESVAVGHVRSGAPFRYTANVRFDAHGGPGAGNERRSCTLTFTKQ